MIIRAGIRKGCPFGFSMNVKFTTFYKEESSTARPNEYAAEYDCILMDSCTVQNPAIKLNVGQNGNPTSYNYARIDDFNRCYFISDWEWSGRLWIARLSVDVLATYRETIFNSTQYVTRSASAWDTAVVDTLYPTKAAFTSVTKIGKRPHAWTDTFNSGTFVLGIIGGGSGGNTGAVTYYEMDPAQYRAFCNYLYTPSNYNSSAILEDISEALWKSMFNPFQYIVSAMWFPFKDESGRAISEIRFGWYKMGQPARVISDTTRVSDVLTLDVPKHPRFYTGKGFRYLNLAPYASYMIHFNPWGNIQLNPTWIVGVDKITLSPYIDLTTGKAILNIYAGADSSGLLLQSIPAQVGVPIPIAQQNSNILGGLSSIVGGIGGGAAGAAMGAVASGVIGSASGVADGVSQILGEADMRGVQGSTAGLAESVRLIAKFMVLNEEDPEHYGYPLMARRQLKTLSGYCLCENADIATSGSDAETRKVQNFLNSGVFLR